MQIQIPLFKFYVVRVLKWLYTLQILQGKGVKLAAHYSKFIDIGTEFRKIYPQ